MMKEFGTLRLITGEQKRTLNYTTYNDKIVVLTKMESQKIKDIEENNQVDLAFGKEIVSMKAEVISDKDFVKEIFDQMLVENNTHFKIWKDNLVVIQFTL